VWLRYAFAFVLSLAGVLASVAFLWVDDSPFYALLIGCVAVAIWFGGLGPGLFTTASCWTAGYVLFVGEAGALDTGGTREERIRWGTSLLIALGVVWVAALLRAASERATTAAVVAHETIRDVAALQDLAAASSTALTQADVAKALIERIPTLVGARGGAVGLVDMDELVVVDPHTGTGLTHRPGARIPLSARAPIAQAAVTGEAIVVRDRASFEAGYPDGFSCTLDILNKTERLSAAQVIQANLAEIGIAVQINQHDSGTFWVLGSEADGDQWKNVQLIINRFSMQPDPSFATEWFTPEQVGVWNWERFSNEEFGELNRQAMVTTDPAERDRMYQRMQDLMEQSGAYVFLTHEVNGVIFRDSIIPALLPDANVVLPEFRPA